MAPSTATTMSARQTSPKPPASASPLSAATSGVPMVCSSSNSCTAASANTAAVLLSRRYGPSAPPQKVVPAPVSTMAGGASASALRSLSSSQVVRSASSMLRSPRSSVIHTEPSGRPSVLD
nr:hypothetical protein [Nakamurella aerolata]